MKHFSVNGVHHLLDTPLRAGHPEGPNRVQRESPGPEPHFLEGDARPAGSHAAGLVERGRTGSVQMHPNPSSR
jgi:hypothetical protein